MIHRGRIRSATVVIAFAALSCACSRSAPPAPASTEAAAPYAAMARGQVDVEGGLLRVAAARDGRIESVAVADGADVQAGGVLATLDSAAARITVASAMAGLEQAQAQAGVLKAKLPQADAQAKRLHEAAGADAATGQAADEAAGELAVLKAEIVAAEAAVGVARHHIDEAQLELDARTLKAPADGRIVRRAVQVGDIVSAQAGTALFELLPKRARIVRAELNEAYVDLVKPGMRAEVVRDSDQGTAVPAHVLRIGDVFGPSRLTDDPLERAGARDVECVLELDGGEFRIGQRVLVRFLR